MATAFVLIVLSIAIAVTTSPTNGSQSPSRTESPSIGTFTALQSAPTVPPGRSRASRSLSHRSLPPDVIVHSLVLAISNRTVYPINHAYWFKRLYRTRLSAPATACMRNGSVLFAETGQCYDLFDQGPCRRNEWLVIEGVGDGRGMRVRCARRPCAPGYGFEAQRRICVPQEQLCLDEPDARHFQYSLIGEGYCLCSGLRLLGPDGRCHVLYSRGPCHSGQMLAPSYSPTLDAVRGVCVHNPCPEGEHRVERENGSLRFNCASVGDLCAWSFAPLFTKEINLAVPLCVDDDRREAIRVISRPSGCVLTNAGSCSKVVVRSLLPFDWSPEDDEPSGDVQWPEDAHAASSTGSRLRRYLTPYTFFSLFLL